jgi:hypothetical protein
MPLTGVCPACGSETPIEAYLADTDAREALGALLALLPERERRLIPRYAALFAPPARRVQWPKLTRVLRELSARIEAGQVERRAQVRACTRAQWLDAVEAVLRNHEAGTVRVPLADHAYLDGVAWEQATPKPGSYTAPIAAPAAPAQESALSPAQIGAVARGLRRQIERLADMGAAVPEQLREQLAAAEAAAGGAR